jgi:hypothetical protein
MRRRLRVHSSEYYKGQLMKRFLDTDLWSNRPWFRMLSPKEKAAWFYVTSMCDNVGVWPPDFEHANYMIGEEIDWEAFLGRVNNNIEVLQNGKWFIVDFCEFQHSDLLSGSVSKPCMSYAKLIIRHNLQDRFPGVKALESLCKAYGIAYGIAYKEREEERVKEEEEEKEHWLEIVKKKAKGGSQ